MRASRTRVQLKRQDAYAARQRETAMEHSNNRHQGAESRRSTRMDLNPYMIEDVGMTLGEWERVRTNDRGVLFPR